jgi:hypothetical protein
MNQKLIQIQFQQLLILLKTQPMKLVDQAQMMMTKNALVMTAQRITHARKESMMMRMNGSLKSHVVLLKKRLMLK